MGLGMGLFGFMLYMIRACIAKKRHQPALLAFGL